MMQERDRQAAASTAPMPNARPWRRSQAPQPRSGAPKAQGLTAVIAVAAQSSVPSFALISTGATGPIGTFALPRIYTALTDTTSGFVAVADHDGEVANKSHSFRCLVSDANVPCEERRAAQERATVPDDCGQRMPVIGIAGNTATWTGRLSAAPVNARKLFGIGAALVADRRQLADVVCRASPGRASGHCRRPAQFGGSTLPAQTVAAQSKSIFLKMRQCMRE
jgi:hypothetical protein